MLLSTSTAEVDQAVTDDRGHDDTGTRVCWQSTRLLQHRLGWCQWPAAAQIASNSERRGSYHHRNKEVRADEASSARSSLATYQATDHL